MTFPPLNQKDSSHSAPSSFVVIDVNTTTTLADNCFRRRPRFATCLATSRDASSPSTAPTRIPQKWSRPRRRDHFVATLLPLGCGTLRPARRTARPRPAESARPPAPSLSCENRPLRQRRRHPARRQLVRRPPHQCRPWSIRPTPTRTSTSSLARSPPASIRPCAPRRVSPALAGAGEGSRVVSGFASFSSSSWGRSSCSSSSCSSSGVSSTSCFLVTVLMVGQAGWGRGAGWVGSGSSPCSRREAAVLRRHCRQRLAPGASRRRCGRSVLDRRTRRHLFG